MERLSNLGYLALSKETTKGTIAAVPNKYIPVYDESLTTNLNLDEDNPIVGNKAVRFQSLLGLRNHQGDITALAEPNTAGYILDMLLTKGTTSGSGPYTHPFTLDNSSNPNSYTIDISKGNVVFRFLGVEASELSPDFDDNKMIFKLKASALKSFIVREISSVVTATVTLKTNYDTSPTTGLIAGDIVRILDVSAGTTQDFTISSVDSSTAITLDSSPSSITDGDLFYIRPSTPSFSLETPFTWARTEFRFSTTASLALSATQTRLEQGSKWTVIHKFESDEGAPRSGAYDPAALVRTQGDASLDVKRFFDSPEEMNRFLTATKRACVVRHFSETGYELRVTLNNLKISENPTPLNTSEIIYSEPKFIAEYDSSDAQMFDVKVLNNVSSI